MAEFNLLPRELFFYIFSKLTNPDLLAKRQVSTNWKEMIDAVRVEAIKNLAKSYIDKCLLNNFDKLLKTEIEENIATYATQQFKIITKYSKEFENMEDSSKENKNNLQAKIDEILSQLKGAIEIIWDANLKLSQISPEHFSPKEIIIRPCLKDLNICDGGVNHDGDFYFSYWKISNCTLNLLLQNSSWYETELTEVTFGPDSEYILIQLAFAITRNLTFQNEFGHHSFYNDAEEDSPEKMSSVVQNNVLDLYDKNYKQSDEIEGLKKESEKLTKENIELKNKNKELQERNIRFKIIEIEKRSLQHKRKSEPDETELNVKRYRRNSF